MDVLKIGPTRNVEHPPLGKYLIAGSMKILGDGPLGWRGNSALSGAIAILLCFLIGELIFKDLAMAIKLDLGLSKNKCSFFDRPLGKYFTATI